MKKLENKITNFNKAILRLKESIYEYKQNIDNDVIRDGVIQRFEFTYELAWKTTKEFLEDIGIVDNTSPKSVIKEAFSQRLISNESHWLLMLNDRNLTSHVYNEEMAKEISERIVNIYSLEFENLLAKLKV